jgi:uncharacterized protein (TIGR02246 family)
MSGRMILIAGAAALALTTGGCKWHHNGHANTGAIKDSISAQEKQWNDQFQAKPMNVDALVAHYAPDAYFVAPGLKPASGSDAVRKAYVEGLKDPNFGISFAADKIDVAASGDMAYSRGRFTETYTDPKTKKAASASGSFITVYKKQSDGSWKAVEDFAAADPAG